MVQFHLRETISRYRNCIRFFIQNLVTYVLVSLDESHIWFSGMLHRLKQKELFIIHDLTLQVTYVI